MSRPAFAVRVGVSDWLCVMWMTSKEQTGLLDRAQINPTKACHNHFLARTKAICWYIEPLYNAGLEAGLPHWARSRVSEIRVSQVLPVVRSSMRTADGPLIRASMLVATCVSERGDRHAKHSGSTPQEVMTRDQSHKGAHKLVVYREKGHGIEPITHRCNKYVWQIRTHTVVSLTGTHCMWDR